MKLATKRRLWLALPAFLLCFADQVVTLVGQPREYWGGDPAHVMEGAPHGRILLTIDPRAYIAAAAFYLAFIVVGIVWLPRFLALVAASGFVIGHTWGVCWWIYHFTGDVPDRSYWLCFGLFILSGFLLALGTEWSGRGLRNERADSPGTS